MSPADALQSLAAPFLSMSVLLSTVLFWCIGAFALALFAVLGSFVPLLGLMGAGFVALIAIPALLRYVLAVAASRAEHRALPAVDTDLFLLLSAPRELAAVPLVVALVLAVRAAIDTWPAGGYLVALVCAGVLAPLSLLMLALTNSPLDSVNPLRLARFAVRLWPAGLWQVLATVPALLVFAGVLGLGGSGYLLLAVTLGLLLPLACLAGALAGTLDVRAETTIPVAEPPDAAAQSAALIVVRRRVLSHAYGLVSRGNRDGGFGRVQAHCATEPDALRAELWFFHAMQSWDLADAPLYFGQALIGRLLDAGDNAAALKVMTACVHASERFRPLPQDTARLQAAATAAGRSDICALLAGQD